MCTRHENLTCFAIVLSQSKVRQLCMSYRSPNSTLPGAMGMHSESAGERSLIYSILHMESPTVLHKPSPHLVESGLVSDTFYNKLFED